MGNDTKKQEFLAIGKWACRYAGVKVAFDTNEGPWVDIQTKVIHLPKRIAVADIPVWIATLVHEAMHIKHTPLWLSSIARDDVDKTIINCLEDERIERLACRQLKALHHILAKMVDFATKDVPLSDKKDEKKFPMQVLANHACKNSRRTPFCYCYPLEHNAKPILANLEKRHVNIITKVTPTAFKSNLTDYYQEIDKLRQLLNLKPDEKKKEQKQEKKSVKGAGGQSQPRQGEGKREEQGNVQQINNGALQQAAGITTGGNGHGDAIDMEGMAITKHSLGLETVVRERVKAALKKTLNTTRCEGNELDTDELMSFMVGDCDPLFKETRTEKKMKTKVTFLLDTSGSMAAGMNNGFDEILDDKQSCPSRLQVSHGAFNSIQQIIDELREEDGCDIESDAIAFATSVEKWDFKDGLESLPNVGGGTSFLPAMKFAINKVLDEDASNKRILVVLTDGDCGNINEVEQLIQQTGQDIRVVFLRIGDGCSDPTFFKHHIDLPSSANTAIFECFEEAIDG